MAKKARLRQPPKKAKEVKKTKKVREPLFDMPRTKVRVIGVGGGGGNIVAEVASRMSRVDFVAANTDLQDLKKVPSRVRRFPFGASLTQGLGCGMDADLGERAARAEKDKIKKLFEGQDVSIIVASLGGGTGSGAAVVFAEAAKEAKSLTLGMFTLPFEFEGKKRKEIAIAALDKMRPLVNAYALVPNEKIFQVVEKTTPFPQALSLLNKNLADSLGGLIEALYSPGLINIDFADVKSILEGRGRLAYPSAATAAGSDRTRIALNSLFSDPLYGYSAQGADRILLHLQGGKNLKMQEVAEVSRSVFSLNPKAKIILGITLNSQTKDKLRVTLFAVGCRETNEVKQTIQQPELSSKKQVLAKKQGTASKRARLNRLAAKLAAKQAKTKTQAKHSSSKAEQEQQEGKEEEAKRFRRNALDLKEELEGELQEIQEEEKKWDVPAFLRVKAKR